MSEETLTAESNSEATPSPSTADTPAVATQTDTQPANDITIPKSRFDEVNNQLKALKAQQDKAAKEREAAEKAALAEQNKYKELYEKAEQERQAAEQKANQLAHDSLRQRIATESGHPKLWNRLQGDDEDALKADMALLMESLPKPQAPGLDGGAGGGNRTAVPNAPSAAQIREMAARLNVDPVHMAAQYGVSLERK